MKALFILLLISVSVGAFAQNDSVILNNGLVIRGQIKETNDNYIGIYKDNDTSEYLINKRNVARYTLRSSSGKDYHVSVMRFDPSAYRFDEKGHDVKWLKYTPPAVSAGNALMATGALWIIGGLVEGLGFGLRSAPLTYAGVVPIGGGVISLMIGGAQLRRAHDLHRRYKFID